MKRVDNIEEMARSIVALLEEKDATVSFAESCTGGRFAATLTKIPGASHVFHGAMVTYANEIKHRWLGVSEEILQSVGAVSEACVDAMLEGIAKRAECDYAVAVSGIAGPDGGTPLKPVGTVYIGIKTPENKRIFLQHFKGDRHAVQEQSVYFGYEKLLDALINGW